MIKLKLEHIKKYFNLHSQVGSVRIYEYKRNKLKSVTACAADYCDGYISVFVNGWDKRIDTFEGLIAYLKLK